MSIDKPSTTIWVSHVRRAVVEIDSKWPTTSAGTYPGHHPTPARAVDFMVPSWQTKTGRAIGTDLAQWVWANRERLGVWYIIFNKLIISETRPEQGWIPYTNPVASRRGTPSGDHLNHVHVSFNATAPPVKTYLPPMQVGPQRLLACNPTKGTITWREVGHPVTTIVRTAGAYSVTDSGNYYPTAMLEPQQ